MINLTNPGSLSQLYSMKQPLYVRSKKNNVTFYPFPVVKRNKGMLLKLLKPQEVQEEMKMELDHSRQLLEQCRLLGQPEDLAGLQMINMLATRLGARFLTKQMIFDPIKRTFRKKLVSKLGRLLKKLRLSGFQRGKKPIATKMSQPWRDKRCLWLQLSITADWGTSIAMEANRINLPSADLVETEAEQASDDGKETEQGREEGLPLAAALLASFTIPDQEMGVHAFVLTLEKQELPQGRKQGMKQEVEEIKKKMAILAKTDDRLKLILDFNKHLIILDKKVSEDWLGEGRKRLDSIKNHTELLSLEDRVTKTTEVQENIKVSSDAKKLIKELETVRAELSKLDVEIKSECAKFNEDIKHLAEFQTGIKTFEPWVKEAKQKNIGGLNQPKSFVESCKILRNSKNLQDECEAELKTLEEAACSASRMTTHDDASKQEAAFKEGWVSVHETTKERVARMTTLVECWNKLDGHVGKLSSWDTTKDSAAPEGKSEISIEKLGSQLNTQRTMFAEKQKLVADFETMVPDMEVVLHLLLQHLPRLLQKLPQKPQLQRLQHRHLLNCKGVVSLYFILYDNP